MTHLLGAQMQVRSLDVHENRVLLGCKNNSALIVDLSSKAQRLITEVPDARPRDA